MLAWGFACMVLAILLAGYLFSNEVRYIIDNIFFRGVVAEALAHKILPLVLLFGAVYCGYRAVGAAGPPKPNAVVDAKEYARSQVVTAPRLADPSGSSQQPAVSNAPVEGSRRESARHPRITNAAVPQSLEIPQTPVAAPVAPAMIFRTTVIREKRRDPIAGAVVTVEDQSAQSDDQGDVSLPLYHVPAPETQVHFSHESCVPRVFRFDDPAAQREVVLASKLRVIVVDFGRPSDALVPTIRIAMEEQLNSCREISVLAGSKRDEIVKQLYQYQEGRALYEKETLAKVGNLHGATHGVFGSIKPGSGGQIVLECSLVHLESARQLASASVTCTKEEEVKLCSQHLADRLLAQLCEVKILMPLRLATVPTKNNVRGHAVFLPRSWTLWISVLPLDNHRHFFQLSVTVPDDGRWLAPAVHVGSEASVPSNLHFEIYAVLADPEANKLIQQYHAMIEKDHNKNDGLDLELWDRQTYRILTSVEVVSESDGRTN